MDREKLVANDREFFFWYQKATEKERKLIEIVDANEDLLRDKYLKGSSPNKLLDIKGSKQGKISYNEGMLPVQQFPETKSSLMHSQAGIQGKIQEGNDNYQSYGFGGDELNVDDNNYESNEGMKENNRY